MSELIFASSNPQYDGRLFIVHENCKLRIPAEHVVYKNCCFCFVLTFRTILVHNMFCRCCELLKNIYLYLISMVFLTGFFDVFFCFLFFWTKLLTNLLTNLLAVFLTNTSPRDLYVMTLPTPAAENGFLGSKLLMFI